MSDTFADELYSEMILDHAENTAFRGELTQTPFRAEAFNPLCGDQIQLFLDIDPQGRIQQVRFTGTGCSISQASASMLAERLQGKTVAEAREVQAEVRALIRGKFQGDRTELGDLSALEAVSRSPMRVKCASLAWMALEDALARWSEPRV